MKRTKSAKASFMVVGTKRSGTTSLAYCLSQHPHIKLCPTDLSGSFLNNEMYRDVKEDDYQYDALYTSSAPEIIHGEVCADYIFNDLSIKRLQNYNPELKLISILRNPAERAYSHWSQATYDGLENRPFMEAISDESRQLDTNILDAPRLTTSYLSRSMYGTQIKRLYQYFDPHQLLFLRADDFKFDTEVLLYQVLQFLNVPYQELDCTAQNVGHYTTSLKVEHYNAVVNLCIKDIYLTEELLGWNCNDWIRPANVSRPMEAYFL